MLQKPQRKLRDIYICLVQCCLLVVGFMSVEEVGLLDMKMKETQAHIF